MIPTDRVSAVAVLTELGRAQTAVRGTTSRCEDVGASPHDDAGPVGREFLFPQTTEGATT
jgi:hypothetical protein